MSIKVIFVDDHAILREGIRRFLTRPGGGISVVGEAANGNEFLCIAKKIPADVYLIDLNLPDMDGFEILDKLLKQDPTKKAIIMSIHADIPRVQRAIHNGAMGYVTKNRAYDDLLKAIRKVYAGEHFLSSDVAEAIDWNGESGDNTGYFRLSPREQEVFKLAGSGLSDNDIAMKLHISSNTVHTHRRHIMKKLDIHKQADLVRYAVRNGFVEP